MVKDEISISEDPLLLCVLFRRLRCDGQLIPTGVSYTVFSREDTHPSIPYNMYPYIVLGRRGKQDA